MSVVIVPSTGITWARVRASRILSRVGKGLFVLVLLLSYGWRAFPSSDLGRTLSAGSWLLAVATFVASFVVWFMRPNEPGSVALDDQTLRVVRGAKTREIARASIASAYVIARLVRRVLVPTVEIVLDTGDIVAIQVESEARGKELVDALGFGPGGKSVTIDTASPSRRMMHILYGIGAYYFGAIIAFIPLIIAIFFRHNFSEPPAWAGILVAPATLLVYQWFRSRARAPVITVGDDGIAYTRGRKREVLPRADILSIEQAHPGNPIFINTRIHPFPITIAGTGIDLERRAAAGRLAYDRFFGLEARGRSDHALAFERGERTVAEWREHLRGLFAQGNYRVAGATVDDATTVLRSPLASPEQRIGAALALRIAGEPVEKIRIAADAVVDEDTRVALEAIAGDGDEIAIEKAARRIGIERQ